MKTKRIYLEVLRIISIIFVIFNHTSEYAFLLFTKREPGSPQFWVYLFISICCKAAVPVFFAISGSLMLSKEESLSGIFRKALKFFIILFVFSLIYYMNHIHSANLDFNWTSFLERLRTAGHRAHLWFLYAYIGLILSSPFVKRIADHLDDRYFIYLLILFLIYTGITPIYEYLADAPQITSNIGLEWMEKNIIIYPIVGYYLDNKVDINKAKKFIPLTWVTAILGVVAECYVTYIQGMEVGVFSGKSQTFLRLHQEVWADLRSL